MNKDQIAFNIKLQEDLRNSNVRSCIRGGVEKQGCSGKIIDAHSIQRGKILAAMADAGEVYYLGLTPAEDLKGMETEFKRKGIKKFSTFNGFCGHHDKKIFQPIEDAEFTGTDLQMSIYAYRAAARELHQALEDKKLCEHVLGDKLNDECPAHYQFFLPKVLKGEYEVPSFIKDEMISSVKNQHLILRHKNSQHNIAELQSICDDLTREIEGGQASGFEHRYRCIDQEYPVACCVTFIPYFDHRGMRVISRPEVIKLALAPAASIFEMKNVLLNVFPEGGKTHVIFTFSKGNTPFKKAIERMLGLGEAEFKVALSNFILNYSENTAFSPLYIEGSFSDKQRAKIISIFSRNISDVVSFAKGDLNLFVDAENV
ncbi:hypothetical protein D3C76_98980 [compost metagenome]